MESRNSRNRQLQISSVNKSSLIGIGVTEILLGLSSIGCCIATILFAADRYWDCYWDIKYHYHDDSGYHYIDCDLPRFSLSAQGIWAGTFTLFAGCINIDFGANPSKKLASYSTGFSTFSTLLNLAMVCLEVFAVSDSYYYYYYYSWTLQNLHIALLSIASLQVIFTFTTSVLSCCVGGCGECCGNEQVNTVVIPMTSTAYPQQGAVNNAYMAEQQTRYLQPQPQQMWGHQPSAVNETTMTSNAMHLPGAVQANPPSYDRGTSRQPTQMPETSMQANERHINHKPTHLPGNVAMSSPLAYPGHIVRQHTQMPMPISMESQIGNTTSPETDQINVHRPSAVNETTITSNAMYLPGVVEGNPPSYGRGRSRQPTQIPETVIMKANERNINHKPTQLPGNVAMSSPLAYSGHIVRQPTQMPMPVSMESQIRNTTSPEAQLSGNAEMNSPPSYSGHTELPEPETNVHTLTSLENNEANEMEYIQE
ncbi:uncharacterized protein LOC120346527 isoform X1 [Styela clava]